MHTAYKHTFNYFISAHLVIHLPYTNALSILAFRMAIHRTLWCSVAWYFIHVTGCLPNSIICQDLLSRLVITTCYQDLLSRPGKIISSRPGMNMILWNTIKKTDPVCPYRYNNTKHSQCNIHQAVLHGRLVSRPGVNMDSMGTK